MQSIYIKKLKDKGLGILSYIQLLFYSSLQLFRINLLVNEFFIAGSGRFLIDAGIILFSLLDFFLVLRRFIQAKNKNWVEVGNFVFMLVADSVFSIAAIGCMISPLIFNPMMMGITFAYLGCLALKALVNTIYHFYLYKTTQDVELKTAYLEKCKESLKVLAGCAFAFVMMSLTAAFFGTPVGWVCGITLAAATVGFVLYSFLSWAIPKIIQKIKHLEPKEELPPLEVEVSALSPALQDLCQRVEQKIHQIEVEMHQEKETFLGKFQEAKRGNKLQLLRDIKQCCAQADCSSQMLTELPSASKKEVFQSFFKRVGEVEMLYEEARALCQAKSRQA